MAEDAFAAPPGEEADSPTDRPKHIFIHPRILTQVNGPKMMRSKQLAWALIETLTGGLNDAGLDQERAKIGEERESAERRSPSFPLSIRTGSLEPSHALGHAGEPSP